MQLATYAWLLDPKRFAVQCAFFLFPIPHGKRILENPDADWKEVWKSGVELWCQQQDKIRVGTEDLRCLPETVEPPCKYCDYKLLCGREEAR